MTSKYIISAKFGKKEIVSADINSQFANTVINEWTDNLIYRNAKNCEVVSNIGRTKKSENEINNARISFTSLFPIIDDKTSTEFFDKKSNFESQLMKKKDIIQSQKDILNTTINIDSKLSSKELISKTIKEKLYDLIKSDENLRKKLKVNNNLSNINLPGSNVLIPNISTIPSVQPNTNNNPYQYPNIHNQTSQSHYNYNPSGYSNYSYK